MFYCVLSYTRIFDLNPIRSRVYVHILSRLQLWTYLINFSHIQQQIGVVCDCRTGEKLFTLKSIFYPT